MISKRLNIETIGKRLRILFWITKSEEDGNPELPADYALAGNSELRLPSGNRLRLYCHVATGNYVFLVVRLLREIGDIFNVHGCWEWEDGKIIIFELPSDPHNICNAAIVAEVINACQNILRTDARIYNLGSAQEADASFIPKKLHYLGRDENVSFVPLLILNS
ncbi:3440_t:CDS:2 [Diversispora eburnea]|uniref:3440_t:CDS:1 n=1 Tax=Diversispora eburnea TaxID=1213867 RepID=A0A9N8YUS3_9GLOM|nr:3440_t:CDS:2 [Diversispora eburnea]